MGSRWKSSGSKYGDFETNEIELWLENRRWFLILSDVYWNVYQWDCIRVRSHAVQQQERGSNNCLFHSFANICLFAQGKDVLFFFEISRHSNHMIFELSKTMLVGDMRQMTLQCLLKREICLRTVALTNSAGTCSRGVAQIYTLKVPWSWVEGKRKNIIYIISSAWFWIFYEKAVIMSMNIFSVANP